MSDTPNPPADDLAALRQRAQLAAKRFRWNEALAAWTRVAELDPDDLEAARSLAEITIERSRLKAGLRNLAQDQAVAKAEAGGRIEAPEKRRSLVRFEGDRLICEIPNLPDDIRHKPAQQLELAIKEYPAISDFYLQLTSLYLEKGRDYDAERLLAKAREATQDDPRIRELWEDITMLRLASRVTTAEQLAASDDTPKNQTALAEARSKRDRLETEIFIQRCKRAPEDFGLRYQLGLRLKGAGKLREAMQRFTEALQDPDQKPAAAFELGECHQQTNDFAQAFKHYRLAADSARPGGLDWRKQALYQAGKLALRLKLLKRAQAYLNDVVQLDRDYRDAGILLYDAQQAELKTANPHGPKPSDTSDLDHPTNPNLRPW